jgi:hypothetical protein
VILIIDFHSLILIESIEWIKDEKQSTNKISGLLVIEIVTWWLRSICVHGDALTISASGKSFRAVIALIFFGIEFQSTWAWFTNVALLIKNRFVPWTDAFTIVLIPNHVVGAAFAHFVLSVVFGRARRTFTTSFFHFIVIFVFIGIAVCACVMSLVNGLNHKDKEEEPKYFFIHLNKNYIQIEININLQLKLISICKLFWKEAQNLLKSVKKYQCSK